MINIRLLLDTCAVLWIANDQPIAKEARDAVVRALEAEEPVFVSPITAWEIGLLAARGRISLRMSPEKWFERMLEAPGVTLPTCRRTC
jgi:PIN domain nuclease of toxin-antitoxin system